MYWLKMNVPFVCTLIAMELAATNAALCKHNYKQARSATL